MFNRLLISIVSLVGTISLVGCTKEEECPKGMLMSDVELNYSYTLHDKQGDLYDRQVGRLDILVFDANDLFRHEIVVADPARICNGQPIGLSLVEGRYTFVTWAGSSDWYRVGEVNADCASAFSAGLRPGVTRLEDLRLSTPYRFDSQMQRNVALEPEDLYHAQISKVDVSARNKTRLSMPLTSDTHRIRVSVIGLRNLPGAGQRGVQQDVIDFSCVAANGRYRYDNSIDTQAGEISYRPDPQTISGDTVRTSFKVMRVMFGHPILLTLTDHATGTRIAQVDVPQILIQSPLYNKQRDLDREDVFDVEFRVQPDLSVIVLVGGWRIVDVTPIVH